LPETLEFQERLFWISQEARILRARLLSM